MPGNEDQRYRESLSRDANRFRPAAVAGAMLVIGLALGLLIFSRRVPLAPVIKKLETWVQGLGIWGPLLYGMVYVVAVAAFVPSWPLTVASGAIFGVAMGTVTASLASTTGAAVSFLISRYLARGLVSRKFAEHPRFAAIDREISRKGALIVALLRLSPAVPFGIQNYLYGLTGIGFGTYLLTSWAAMLPGTSVYVYLGYLGRAGLDAAGEDGPSRSPVEWALLAVGLIATAAVTLIISRLAHRALREAERT
jgi:uncharacterized membrane protein YdjX (TVP38/TMEM64 family)